VKPPVPESLRLYSICAALKFSALPVAGGLYDQDPQLLEEWSYIIERRAERDREEQERASRKSKSYQRRR